MMKRLTLIFGIASLVLQAQTSPEVEKKFFPIYSNDIPTPAFSGKKISYTQIEELVSFGKQLEALSSNFKIDTIGYSHGDRPIIAWRIGSSNKGLKIWFQGGLHGNEPASTEGVMYFCHELLSNPDLKAIKEEFNFLIVPMANPDGYCKQKRYNGENLDLNRDQTAYFGHETPSLKKAFYAFDPDVAIDFHEYKPYRADYAKMNDFGVTQLNDVMMLPSGNLNVDAGLRKLNVDLLVTPNQEMLKAKGMHSGVYVSTRKEEGVTYLNYGSTSSRSSSTSYGLSNCMSILFEFRGVGLNKKSFSRRVTLTKEVAVNSLKEIYKNKEKVRTAVDQANAKTLQSEGDYVVRFKHKQEQVDYQFIDLGTQEIVSLNLPLKNGLELTPTIQRERPKAYIIPASETRTIANLEINDIAYEVLEQDVEMNVERFKINKRWESSQVFQKIHTVQARGVMEEVKMLIPKGSFMVYTNQKNGNYLGELLEPEAPNSYTHFRIVECELNEYHPYLRLKK